MSLWNDLNELTQLPNPPLLPDPKSVPNFCENSKGLRQFLNHSRNLSDDVLKQRLNSVLTHNEKRVNSKKFDRDEVCKEFVKQVLIKSWNERLTGLEFCGKKLMALEQDIEQINKTKINKDGIDLRFDPYAIRDLENEKELKLLEYNSLKNFLTNEKRIEAIIQDRSKEIIYDYCGVSNLINDFQK